ncbi:NAD-dependent epimerase/dehydratase family protein [Candidatus Pelagibacter sp.]|uniref:NAD-dependent epimerase/dehydratase family protein n=1 Tax=Candidatus Pelagibacter sp. TaxID=2024849 RepID=UPI003F84497B
MRIKLLLIGSKSFIALNLEKILKKKFDIKIISFEKFVRMNENKLSKIDYIINCSIHKDYFKKKYLTNNDLDLKIAKKIKKFDTKFIFLSTRKVYNLDDNIKETSKKTPKCNYSKNKLISEGKLYEILRYKLLILRISNIIGHYQKKNNRRIHNTFVNQFFKDVKKNIVYDNKKLYRDFISINQFSEIIKVFIKNNSHGIYNVSMGKKVYLKKIIQWLNFYNKKKITQKKLPITINKSQNFYLNNRKLLKETKLKLSLTKLEKDCKNISKLFFKS